MYKLCPTINGQINGIKRLSDNATIPICDDNTDYQAYLKWVAQGNSPLPADEVKQ